jgi:sulfatase modifying factor 1
MEWVADWYSDTYYFESPSDNPQGPEVGEYRALRGGSFFGNAQEVRSSARLSAGVVWETFYDLIGFRCVYSELSQDSAALQEYERDNN